MSLSCSVAYEDFTAGGHGGQRDLYGQATVLGTNSGEFREHHTQFLTCSHGSDGLPAWLDWLVSLFLAFHTTSPSGETVV